LKVCLNRRSDGVKERPDALSTKGHDDWRLLIFRRLDDGDGDGELSGFLGLALNFDEEHKRVMVDDTLEGSPAAKAGLKKGDVVESIGGEGVAGLREAVAAARRAKPRSQLAVRVRRDGEAKEIMVRVGVLPFTAIADLD
jgi:serine protease Do